MKRLHPIYLAVFLLAVLCSSCTGNKVDPEFVATSDFSLKVKDDMVFKYDPLTCQVAFNREKSEFRVHTDNMSDYYCLDLKFVPTGEGQKVKGDITWTSRSDVVKKSDLSFVVKKVDRTGKMWLWCRKERIGAVIQVLD